MTKEVSEKLREIVDNTIQLIGRDFDITRLVFLERKIGVISFSRCLTSIVEKRVSSGFFLVFIIESTLEKDNAQGYCTLISKEEATDVMHANDIANRAFESRLETLIKENYFLEALIKE